MTVVWLIKLLGFHSVRLPSFFEAALSPAMHRAPTLPIRFHVSASHRTVSPSSGAWSYLASVLYAYPFPSKVFRLSASPELPICHPSPQVCFTMQFCTIAPAA